MKGIALEDIKNQNIMGELFDVDGSSGKKQMTLKSQEILRRRVRDLLMDPDPVRGIYAMYGAHDRTLLCVRKK